MSTLEADVAVIGGGPAGATAAKLLADWGHSVVVLTRPLSRTVELGESLPPSTRKVLQHLGLLDAVDGAGFHPTRGNTVWWESKQARVERFADGQYGYQVSKQALELALLARAETAGASVYRDTVVRHVSEQAPDGTRTLHGERDGQVVTVTAPWVLDASGRSGVVARHGWRRSIADSRTLALIATWTSPTGWHLDHESHTLVESYPGGWAWSVPVTAQTRYFTVMVDPRHTDLSSRGAIGACYAAEFGRTVRLKELQAGAILDGPPWACDASPYTADPVAAPGILLVGDAASFIDPLSSFGVKKALASAWLGAVVTNTSLDFPERAESARQLFVERERTMFDTYRRGWEDYARVASTATPHPFWSDRADGVELTPPAGAFDLAALRNDPAVQAAFEDLKRRPSIALVPGPSLTIQRRPAVAGHHIELTDHLVVGNGEPIRYLREVNLPKLVQLAPDHDQVPALFDAYNRSNPPVPLPDFLGALSALLARGALVHRSPV